MVVVCLFFERYVEETLGNGEGALVDCRGDSSLQPHLEQFGVGRPRYQTVPEGYYLFLHPYDGYL